MVSFDLRGEALRIGLLLLAAFLQLFPTGICRCAIRSAPVVKSFEVSETETKKCPCCFCETGSKAPFESKPISPSSQPCPCRLTELVLLPLAKIDLPSDSETGIVFQSTPFPTSVQIVRLNSPTPNGLRCLPWLTKEEKLYAHHVLRC